MGDDNLDITLNAMKLCKKLNCEKGLTLIDVAIALSVIGLLMVPVLIQYNLWLKVQQKSVTEGSMAQAISMIREYAKREGRYPRPASLITTEGDADYGFEVDDLATTTPKICPDLSDGYCQSPDTLLLIGALPHAAMDMDDQFALDFWKNKIFYIVTLAKTDAATFNPDIAGSVQTLRFDQPTQTLVPSDSNSDLLLISGGQTGRGFYASSGIIVGGWATVGSIPNVPCVDPSNPEAEDENCDFDDSVFIMRAEELLNQTDGDIVSDAEGPNFFDDYTVKLVNMDGEQWNRDDDALQFITTQSQLIGIHNDTPQTKIDVRGNVLAENNLQSEDYCYFDGSNYGSVDCFPPALIGGNVDAMDCRSSTITDTQPVVQIGNNMVTCASSLNSGGSAIDGAAFEFPAGIFTPTTCPANQAVRSIINGVVQCAAP